MISCETSESLPHKIFQMFDDTDTFRSPVIHSLDITSYFSGWFYEMFSRMPTSLINIYLTLHF